MKESFKWLSLKAEVLLFCYDTKDELSLLSMPTIFVDANSGWAINSRPKPWRTTNGGITWDSTLLIDNYQAGNLYDIKMINMLTGYCVGANNRTYRTTNGGATAWVNVSFTSSTVYTLYAVESISATEAVVMGTYGKCAYTSNGGVNWIYKDASTINSLNGSFMTPDNKVYAVSSSDAHIFKNSAILTSIAEPVSNNIPKGFTLYQNYPNPFNPKTIIKLEIPNPPLNFPPKEGNVRIDIYNSLGQIVGTPVNEMLDAGEYEITWNAGSLPSGVYFYSLVIDGIVMDTKKMLLIK